MTIKALIAFEIIKSFKAIDTLLVLYYIRISKLLKYSLMFTIVKIYIYEIIYLNWECLKYQILIYC